MADVKRLSEAVYLLRALLGGVHQTTQDLSGIGFQNGQDGQRVHGFVEEISTLLASADTELMSLDTGLKKLRAQSAGRQTNT